MKQLELLRDDLAQCDEILLNTLLMRNRIVERIMEYKENNDMAIIQPDQEKKQRAWLDKALSDKKHAGEIKRVFEAVLNSSKKIQARQLFDYNIVLIGFMGTGKSTISSYLNNVFNMEIVEMDQIIAQREGMSISDIFEIHGEEYFRDKETELLIEMQDKKNVVVSCGGGVPMRERNHPEMKKNGKVVLLTASPAEILERLKDDHSRPLLENNKTVDFVTDLMEKRRSRYEAVADIIINTDGKTKLDICEELIQKLLADN
ncbi:MAG: shikimate kinase [Eubacteriales bacterium]|nr:shikimate kinase [Eubacteriales bacterium]